MVTLRSAGSANGGSEPAAAKPNRAKGSRKKRAHVPETPSVPGPTPAPQGWGAWLQAGLDKMTGAQRADTDPLPTAVARSPSPAPPSERPTGRAGGAAPRKPNGPAPSAATTPRVAPKHALEAAATPAPPGADTSAVKENVAATSVKVTASAVVSEPSPMEKLAQTASGTLIVALTNRAKTEARGTAAISRQRHALDTALTLALRCHEAGADGMQPTLQSLLQTLAPEHPSVPKGPKDIFAFAAMLDEAAIPEDQEARQRAIITQKATALQQRLDDLIQGAKSLPRDAHMQAWNKAGGTRLLKQLREATGACLMQLAAQEQAACHAATSRVVEHVQALDEKAVKLADAHPEFREQVATTLRARYFADGEARRAIAHSPRLRAAMGWLVPNAAWQRAGCDLNGKGYGRETVAVRVMDLVLNSKPHTFVSPRDVPGRWQIHYYKKGVHERAFIGVGDKGERVLLWYGDAHVDEGHGGGYEQAYARHIVDGFRKLADVPS